MIRRIPVENGGQLPGGEAQRQACRMAGGAVF